MSGLDLLVAIDRADGSPGRAIERALRDGIRTGWLTAGQRLPGSRSLAADLGVARGTVVQAYAQLAAEGWLVTATGSGTRVADQPTGSAEAVPAGLSPASAVSAGMSFVGDGWAGTGSSSGRAGGRAGASRLLVLRPGTPDLSSFPRAAWGRSLRRALASAPHADLDYPDPAGLPVLRAAVAAYLARARGVLGGPEAVVITAGFTGGLSLLGRVLAERGAREVATEDPGLARHREVLRAAGLATVPMAVGPDGADPRLPGDAAAALLTPAHQHPTGVVLAPRARAAFVDWARRHDAYLIEDDYDGEFRYDQRPVGAMQALAPDRVVFAGSTSKSLAPGVRLGWFVLPPALRRPFAEAARATGAGVSALDQLAMADLIASGGYDRHIRGMRLAYRRRRADLAATGLPLRGIAAGMHALVPVEDAARERALLTAARRRGLVLAGLHAQDYWATPDERNPAALILGYGVPPAYAWPRVLADLTELVQSRDA